MVVANSEFPEAAGSSYSGVVAPPEEELLASGRPEAGPFFVALALRGLQACVGSPAAASPFDWADRSGIAV